MRASPLRTGNHGHDQDVAGVADQVLVDPVVSPGGGRVEETSAAVGLSGGRLLGCVTACIPVGVGRRFELVVGRLLQRDQGVVSFR